jgi:Bacterial Ig-like domain (group 3)/FG-GAP-like repeat
MRKIVKLNRLIILAAVWGGSLTRAFAGSTPTTVILTMATDGASIPSGGSIESGARLTLSAAVSSGSTALTTGQVDFCDASAPYCTDIHLLGTAQLTSAGTAHLKFIPGIGSQSYKAVFLGTPNGKPAYAPSSSAQATLTVTGRFPTTTSIAAKGSPGDYTATAQVSGYPNLVGLAAPHGMVSFVDATNDNRLLGSARIGASLPGLNLFNSSLVPTGMSPISVATGDFNGDAIPDMAIANEKDDTVSVLLGNGDGTFRKAPQSPVKVGLSPDAIAVGDFNADGKIDLAVANACGNAEACAVAEGSVTILLGSGDGTFTQAKNSPVPAGFAPSSIAVADFNGDGIPDLVTADFGGAAVTVLLGKGDGTFTQTAQSPIAAGDEAWSVALEISTETASRIWLSPTGTLPDR